MKRNLNYRLKKIERELSLREELKTVLIVIEEHDPDSEYEKLIQREKSKEKR